MCRAIAIGLIIIALLSGLLSLITLITPSSYTFGIVAGSVHFFEAMLPALAVAALLKYICSCRKCKGNCACSSCKTDEKQCSR
jgi:hypothetical protein